MNDTNEPDLTEQEFELLKKAKEHVCEAIKYFGMISDARQEKYGDDSVIMGDMESMITDCHGLIFYKDYDDEY